MSYVEELINLLFFVDFRFLVLLIENKFEALKVDANKKDERVNFIEIWVFL